jgi:hypothetical protein
MSKNAREIESKLIVDSSDLNLVNTILNEIFGDEKKRLIFGSSLDHYFLVPDRRARAEFFRVRERDGIRQITVKGEDKGNSLDRLEIDIDSTSPLEDILKFGTAMFGTSIGKVGKTYYVYFLNKWDTVCCYTVSEVTFDKVFVEVEATTMEKMLELEQRVIKGFENSGGPSVARAPGSLFTMFFKDK